MAKRIETLKERKKKFEHKDWLKYIATIDESRKISFKPPKLKPPKPFKPPPPGSQLYAFPTEVLCPPDQEWEPVGFIPGKCI